MSPTKIPVLLQLLFMKKLMILSTSFVCLSTMKFFLLRLDRFIKFLCTSSATVGKEFVLPNLRLSASEDLHAFADPGESMSVRFQSFVSEFRDLARDLGHGKQRRVLS